MLQEKQNEAVRQQQALREHQEEEEEEEKEEDDQAAGAGQTSHKLLCQLHSFASHRVAAGSLTSASACTIVTQAVPFEMQAL